jgi:hypothetical protein
MMVRVKVVSSHCLSYHRAYNSLGDGVGALLSAACITRFIFLARVIVTSQTKPGDPFRRAGQYPGVFLLGMSALGTNQSVATMSALEVKRAFIGPEGYVCF